MSTPRLLGHRGALARAPENTLASFRLAIAEGADGFEFDVRVTADGTAVLLHDTSLARTTGQGADLSETALDEVRKLDAGGWFSEDHAGERVPLLTEVLDEFLGKVPLAMEMKDNLPEADLRDVASRLHELPEAELIVASFRAEPLHSARDLVPAAPRALILRREDALPPPELQQELGLWGVFARQESVDDRFIVEARRAGLSVYAYTVNDATRATQLVASGVNGVISDDPGAVRSGLA
jgi:glycerophosphoryl diester phosphodiesterase